MNEDIKARPPLSDEDRDHISAIFREALAQIEDLGIDKDTLTESFLDAAKSGRFQEVLKFSKDKSLQPPTKAPEIWKPGGEENPGEAIARIYGYWLERDRMHLGILRNLDRNLYERFQSWKRFHKNEIPPIVKEKLISKEEYNSRLIKQGGISDPLELKRIQRVVISRNQELRRSNT